MHLWYEVRSSRSTPSRCCIHHPTAGASTVCVPVTSGVPSLVLLRRWHPPACIAAWWHAPLVCLVTCSTLLSITLPSNLRMSCTYRSKFTDVYEDNTNCIALANNMHLRGRSKHIALRVCFIQKLIQEGLINVEQRSTTAQMSDIHLKITWVSICRLTKHYMSYKALYDIYVFHNTMCPCYVV